MMILFAEFEYPVGCLLFNPDAISVEAELEECFSDKRNRTFKTSGWFKIIMEHHSTIKNMQIERIGIGTRGKLRLAWGRDTPEEYFDVELRSLSIIDGNGYDVRVKYILEVGDLIMVKVTWFDDKFEREELDPKIDRFLNQLGARGEAISKQLTAGQIMPELRAVDKGFMLNAWSFVVGKVGRIPAVRIGTYKPPAGVSLKYVIYVLFGHRNHISGKHVPARPILRTMLAMLKVELK
jgi:hypothetical protein